MERLIKDASKMKDVQKELNVTVDEGDLSFGNIVNAISVVQSEMGIMGTTAEEAEGTISGSLNALKGAWENLLVGMADDEQDFEELFNKLLDSLETFGKNLMPRIEIIVTTALKKILEGIKKLTEGLPPVFGKIIDKLIALAENFRTMDAEQKKQVLSWLALAVAMGPIITIVGKLVEGFGKFIPMIVNAVNWIGGLGGAGTTAGGLTGAISGLVTACGGLAPFLGIVAGAIAGIIAVIKVCKEHWDKLSTAFKNFCDNIGLTEALEKLKERFGQLWEKIKGLEDLFDIIGYILSAVLVPAFHILVAVFNVVLNAIDPLLQILGGFLDILGAIGSFIVGVFTLDLKKCGEAFEKLFKGIGNIVGGLFNLIFKPIKAVIDGVVGLFKWLYDILVGHSIVPDLINAIGKCFKNLLGAPIKFVKDFVGKVGDFFGNLFNKAKEKFSAIGSTISEKLSQAKTKATNVFSEMVSSAKSKLSNLASTVSSKFSNISTKIGEAMSKAKNKVSEMLSKMKTSFANFTAKIKLPHFKIKNASINPKDWITKGAPKLAVEWYAKGGVFDEPTIFNTASGLKGVGEAGPEAVAPISTLQGYVQEAVQVQNAGLEDKLNTLVNILLKYLPSLESRSLVLDTGVLVGELTPKFDKSLGQLTQKKIRGR